MLVLWGSGYRVSVRVREQKSESFLKTHSHSYTVFVAPPGLPAIQRGKLLVQGHRYKKSESFLKTHSHSYTVFVAPPGLEPGSTV